MLIAFWSMEVPKRVKISIWSIIRILELEFKEGIIRYMNILEIVKMEKIVKFI